MQVQLRHKFAALALIYVASLSINLLMSAWCILIYFQSAFGGYQDATLRQDRIEELRTLTRRGRALLESAELPRRARRELRAQRDRIRVIVATFGDGRSDALPPQWPEIRRTLGAVVEAIGQRLAGGDPPGPEARAAFARLDRLLGAAAIATSVQRQSAVTRAEQTRRRVTWILIANAVVGLVLCGVGLLFVRRWVLRPVADLRAATREIARGHFAYRIRPRSRDELGKLAREVNQMAATIVDMQGELVEKERLAAAGEMVTRLAHNIRNPLAGVRGLAEATLQARPDDDEIRQYQQRIIGTIDQFEVWLRRLQQSVAPMEVSQEVIEIRGLVESVAVALRPMAQKRGVRIEISVSPRVRRVRVDISHLEQALVALLTNAIQACGDGQTVRVVVEPDTEQDGRWRLIVADEGPGVPPELREKIFLPYFTTRPDGSGVGLPMAAKIVRAHGGRLSLESEPGRGSRFIATLPGWVE